MYIVLEIQTYLDGNVGTIVQTTNDLNQANSMYHTVLAAAAISQVPIHSCTLLGADGLQIKCESYRHNVEPTE